MSEISKSNTETPINEVISTRQSEVSAHLGKIASLTFVEGPTTLNLDGPVMGVHGQPDGELDWSKASRVSLIPNEEAEVSPQVEPPDSKLKELGQMLRMLDKPGDQMPALRRIIRRDGLSMTADELLKLTRAYAKEQIKSTENGPLFHYHQTSIGNLENIVENGALLSTDEQRRRGIERSSAGSRPDVVQMTRDKYDTDGKLVEAGLHDTSRGLGAAGDIAFVLDETIMDDPEYDSIVKFPNTPNIPLDKLRAVAVSDEKNIPFVEEVFAKKGMEVDVISRAEWLSRHSH